MNPGSNKDNEHKVKEWEHNLNVDKYLENVKTFKEGTKVWAENKGKCYYLVLIYFLWSLRLI